MNLSLIHQINPYIRIAIPSVLKSGHVISQRIIFDYELIYIERGSLQLRYADQDYICRPGDFVLLRPGVSHSLHCELGDLSQPHLHFDMIYTANSPSIPISFKDIDQLTAKERTYLRQDPFFSDPPAPIISFNDTNKALTLFYDVISYYGDSSPLMAKSRLIELIGMIIADNFSELSDTSNDNSYAVADQIKDYIDSGQGFDMRLEDFEKQFSYNRFYLERLFERRYGTGLIAYRNRKRIQSATELLKTMTVTDTAERLSFSSVYTFSRAFKNSLGVSPTKYKAGIK